MANRIDVDVSRRIHASPDAVCQVIGDLNRLPEWLELSAANGGTNVRVHWTGTPKGVMGKLMRSMMQKRITQNRERSLEALDRVASA